MNIIHIDILVHADYIERTKPYPLRSPRQRELINLWDSRVTEIQQQKGNVLFYFSAIEPKILHDYLLGNTVPNFPTDYEELNRIKRYKTLLGDRLFVFGNIFPSELPRGETLSELFQQKGMILDSNTTITSMGEYLTHCVRYWGKNVREVLGLLEDRLSNYSEGTFDYFTEMTRLLEWRKSSNEGYHTVRTGPEN